MVPNHIRTLLLLLATLFIVTTVKAQPDRLVERAPQAPAQPPAAATTTAAATTAPGTSAAPPPVSGGGNVTSGVSGPVSGSPGAPSGIGALPTSADFGNSVHPAYAVFLEPTSSKKVWPIYRIDPRETVTFSWTYSDLKVQPTNLTLVAVGPQSATYVISEMAGVVTSAVWPVASAMSSSPPLMNGYYGIRLYDQRGISAHPAGGYLLPFSSLTIAFYSTENYDPMTGSDYCPTCFYSAAMHYAHAIKPLGIAFGVACVTSAMFIYSLLN